MQSSGSLRLVFCLSSGPLLSQVVSKSSSLGLYLDDVALSDLLGSVYDVLVVVQLIEGRWLTEPTSKAATERGLTKTTALEASLIVLRTVDFVLNLL